MMVEDITWGTKADSNSYIIESGTKKIFLLEILPILIYIKI